jgi:hypothetical protein
MSKKAVEQLFTGTTTPIASYDSTKTNLGTLIKQYNLGANPTDKFAGPAVIGLARPNEQSTAIPGVFPHVLTYDSTTDWVFLADNAAAAATRRIILYEYNKTTSVFNWKGFITLTYPAATAHTIRGFRMIREFYTTGTVGVSGTAVTGSGASWLSDRMSVGCRIGFGSTNPTAITTWYEISAIGGENSITLTSSAGTISSGTPYVIEDLMCLTSTTNATATNGGLFVTKGLRYENFTTSGTTISAATTVDNIRAVYWLADASTVTNTTAAGCAMEPRASWTLQNAYVLNVTGAACYVYNFRAALTLTAGKDTTTNTIKTGNQVLTGTLSQVQNGRIITLSHGPGSGVLSLYFATTTRIYRAAISNITNGNTTWTSDVMVEVPPGSASTFAASAVMSTVDYASDLDRLIIMTTGATSARSYVTQYNTTSAQFDLIFLSDDKQLDQSLADANEIPHPSIQALGFSVWYNGGTLYMARGSAASTSNQIYTIPLGAHWSFASTTNQVLITPALSTSSATKLYRVYVNEVKRLGSDYITKNPEPFKVYARTSGISDNTGAWTLLDDSGTLTSIAASTDIQFKFEFRIIGESCIPARIMGLTVVYEDDMTDSHYQPSVANSSITGNTFAWRQATSWSGTIPNLRIRLYNAVTGVPIIDDTVTASAYGTWQYSSNNGGSWNAWSSSADTVGNYIRYVATSLPGSVRVRALLTQ